MDRSNQEKQHEVEEPRFLDFPHLPYGVIQDGKPRLNRYSSTITKDHDFPGAQVGFGLAKTKETLLIYPQAMLYAAGVPDRESMKNSPHVGVASVWWEGNPCK